MPDFMIRIYIRCTKMKIKRGMTLEAALASWPQLSDADREKIIREIKKEGGI